VLGSSFIDIGNWRRLYSCRRPIAAEFISLSLSYVSGLGVHERGPGVQDPARYSTRWAPFFWSRSSFFLASVQDCSRFIFITFHFFFVVEDFLAILPVYLSYYRAQCPGDFLRTTIYFPPIVCPRILWSVDIGRTQRVATTGHSPHDLPPVRRKPTPRARRAWSSMNVIRSPTRHLTRRTRR